MQLKVKTITKTGYSVKSINLFLGTRSVVCIIYVYTCLYVCMCRVKVHTGAGRVHQMCWSGSSPVLGHELGFSGEQLLKAKANPGPSLKFWCLEKKHSPSPKTRTTFGKASNGLGPRPWRSCNGFGSWEPTASPLKGCGYQSQSHRILVLCYTVPLCHCLLSFLLTFAHCMVTFCRLCPILPCKLSASCCTS